MKDIRGTAFVITEEYFQTIFAKTAHGLVRHTSRFEIKAVIDRSSSGKDAGEELDSAASGIPICDSIDSAIEITGMTPDYCIIGIATAGGVLPESLRRIIIKAIQKGISVICGLHQFMNDIPELANAARDHGVALIDIRKPRPASELSFWSGKILDLKVPRIAVLGMDCAVGKRTTCGMIHKLCRENGVKSEMLYTGQTGWLQGYKYGFIFDATINDFICGEVEKAILECAEEAEPELILIEGQSALRNPSGPCGSEFLLSGGAKGVILQHVPFRKEYDISENVHYPMPSVESEMELIKMYGSNILAITLNGEGSTREELQKYQAYLEEKTGIPVLRPIEEGVGRLLRVLKEFIGKD